MRHETAIFKHIFAHYALIPHSGGACLEDKQAA